MPWKDKDKHNKHVLNWRKAKIQENPNYFKEKYPKEKYYPKRKVRYRTPKGKINYLFQRIKKLQPNTDITKCWLEKRILKGKCELTGIAFDYEKIGRAMPLCPSVDRIDSNIGYYKDNCQVVLWWINVAKQDMPQDYFIKLLKLVEKAL